MSEGTDKVCDLSVETLSQVLKFLTDEEVVSIRSYLDYRVWDAGETLMNDGDSGDFMGFVLAGKLAVKKETNFSGRFTLVAILDRGAMVWEISDLDRGLRTATVVAIQKTEMLLLTCDSLEKILTDRPHLGVKLLKRIINVLSLRQGRAYDRLSSLL